MFLSKTLASNGKKKTFGQDGEIETVQMQVESIIALPMQNFYRMQYTTRDNSYTKFYSFSVADWTDEEANNFQNHL